MSTKSTNRPDILLIDDSVDAIEVLRKSLEEMADLRFALSGEDGLRVARQRRPDLILLDIEMQNFGGFRVLSELKRTEHLSSVPVLFASGHRDPIIEAKGYQEGAVGFIGKPFEPEIVRARVRQTLRTKSSGTPRDERTVRRILLATTDIRLAGTIGDLLRREGIEMILTTDPTAIVALTSVGQFERIILDDSFRGQDALDIYQDIATLPETREIPTLVLLDTYDAEREARFPRDGCVDVAARGQFQPLLLARIQLHAR